MASAWWQEREKGGEFALKLTAFLVATLPKILLKPIVFCVSFCYHLACKNERENINFYLDLLHKRGVKTRGAFRSFYEFSLAICDKFRVWSGKISLNDIDIKNLERIKKEFESRKQGQIMLVSHFGNTDIASALHSKVSWLGEITILLYSKHAAKFARALKNAGASGVKIFEVDELDINTMIRLKEIIQSGGHIGVMGDRTPINGKSARISFLGRECEFPVGAFLLAGILETKISSFWAVSKNGRYEVSVENIADCVRLGRDKMQSAQKYLEIYVRLLERKCEAYPHQFFNFYDFWLVRE